MSEQRVDYFAHSTGEVLRQVQSALQPFAERPDQHNFAAYDVDNYGLVYGGLGSVQLQYNRRNQVQARFVAEEGFAVWTTYQLRAGIYVVPAALDRQQGAVQVEYPGPDRPETQTYYSTRWRDGGYSLQAGRGDNLDTSVVSHIGYVIHLLGHPFTQPPGSHLSVVE